MRSIQVWADRLQDRGAKPQSVHTIAWLSSAHLIAGAGSLLLVYDAAKGLLLQTLNTHKDTIYAVAVAPFNSLVASSGADKTVVLWNYALADATTGGVQLTPAVKYSHADSVQCLAFSPVSGVLCSGTATDFGLWNPETRSVTKTKISAKVTCCSWSSDGQFVALGMYNGTVSIRTKLGEEHAHIDRGPAPIWALQWNPASRSTRTAVSPTKPPNASKRHSQHSDTNAAESLLVTDWSQTIAHYRSSGKLIGRERSTVASPDGGGGGDPLAISYFAQGDFAVVAQSSGSITLWSVGSDPLVRIGPVLDLGDDAWIWSVAMSPSGQQLAWCTQQGGIGVHNIVFHTVHALHLNKYAFRQGLTDVVIQHFDSSPPAATGQRGQAATVGMRQFKLSCRDHVKKLAIYQDKVALLLPSRILIYEQVPAPVDQATSAAAATMGGLVGMLVGMLSETPPAGHPHPLEYRLRDKLDFAPPDCNLLVITTSHLLFCQESTLAMYDFTGTQERAWRFPALIRYIKVIGGPPGREAVVLGMRDGWTHLVYLDNAFAVPLVQHAAAIRCVDLNRARTRLAVVDDLDNCCVYAMDSFAGGGGAGAGSKPLELVYQESGATSVAWNHDHDDLLCFSGRHSLTVKAGTYPPLVQPHSGFVVGFKGTHLYSLHQYSVTVSQVPLATCLYQYMDRKDWPRALAVAHLGVGTDVDWAALGYAALEDLQLGVARQCFARVRDHRVLTFIQYIQAQLTAASSRDLVVADVLAMRGKLDQAADLLCARGHAARAVAMYTDVGLYEYALRVARTHGVNPDAVLKAKASALRDSNDHEAAADTYLQVGDAAQAVKLLIQNGAVERLVVVVQTFGDKLDSGSLAACAAFFKSRGRADQVAQVYRIMGDWKGLVQLHVGQEEFDQAFKLVDERGLPDEARSSVELAYAQYLLTKMEDFAGAMAAFERAGRRDWAVRLVRQQVQDAVRQGQYLDAARAVCRLHAIAAGGAGGRDGGTSGNSRSKLASVLYAYHHVAGYLADPFTALPQATLLSMARYLVMHMHATPSPWILDLSRAVPLVALVRLARDLGAPQLCLDAAKLVRAYRLPAQWQATVDTASVLAAGQVPKDGGRIATEEELVPMCFACSASVPLLLLEPRCPTCRVPFELAMHAFDALPVVQFEVVPDSGATAAATNGPLAISTSAAEEEDPMVHLISLAASPGKREYPIKVDSATLASRFKKDHLLIVPTPSPSSTPHGNPSAAKMYYRILTDVAITICAGCQHLFHADDYEYLQVVHLGCPLCRFDALGIQQQVWAEGVSEVKKQVASAASARAAGGGGGSAGTVGREANGVVGGMGR